MRRARPFLTALALLWAGPAGAQVSLPSGAALTAQSVDEGARYELPVGAHNGDGLPTLPAEGRVTRRAWRIGGTGSSSFQILINLRSQLVENGYEVLFECDEETCGGYDFRYGTEVIAEPEMHVDFGEFQFLSARKPGEEVYTTVLVSRSASAAFVQVITVNPMDQEAPGMEGGPGEPPDDSADPAPDETTDAGTTETGTTDAGTETGGDLIARLERIGRTVLTGLRFETGSASLDEGKYDSLARLAAYLEANPTRRIALVGHTDAEGSLAANISISERRAVSVMDRLVTSYGIAPDRLEAKGIGYLAPIASNQTEQGRMRNRRVEAIVIATQ